MPAEPAPPPPVNVPDPSEAQSQNPIQDNQVFEEAFSGMDKFMSVDGESAPTPAPEPVKEPPAPTPEPEKPEPEVKPPAEEETPKPPAQEKKPAEKKAPEEIKKEPEVKPPDAEYKTPADLRKAYNEAKRQINELKAQNERAKDDPEKKRVMQQIQERDKQIQKLQQEIKDSAWERSDEYRQQFEKPLNDAYIASRNRVASMKKTTEDGDTVQATPEDFDRIMNAVDHEQAATIIEEMFGSGPKAASVAAMRDKVLDLAERKQTALQEYQSQFSEREKQRQEQASASRAEANQLWEFLNTKAAEKYPEEFGDIEGDEKANQLLQEGKERADLAFSNPDLPTRELVALHSEIRNKAAAYPRLKYLNANLKNRVTELEKELEAYKNSEPTTGQGDPATLPSDASPEMDDGTAGLDKIAISSMM